MIFRIPFRAVLLDIAKVSRNFLLSGRRNIISRLFGCKVEIIHDALR